MGSVVVLSAREGGGEVKDDESETPGPLLTNPCKHGLQGFLCLRPPKNQEWKMENEESENEKFR